MKANLSARIILVALCWTCWAGMLIVGLWPFDFVPENHVYWAPTGSGLIFAPQGIAYSPVPIAWTKPHPTAITVELWVKPSTHNAHYYAEILAFYQPDRSKSFTIAQIASTLFVLGRYRAGPKSIISGIDLPDVFHPDESRFVTVVTGPSGTSIYLQGQLVHTDPQVVPLEDTLQGQLVLGHSPSGYHPWGGEFDALAIYGRELNSEEVVRNYQLWTQQQSAQLSGTSGATVLLTFDDSRGSVIRNRASGGNLLIPTHFRPLRRILLELPTRKSSLDTGDVLLNVFGFVPLGFLSAMYLNQAGFSRFRSATVAASLCLATTLLIECLQSLLPSRDSSLTDVLDNVAGGIIGILLAHWVVSRGMLRRFSPNSSTLPVS